MKENIGEIVNERLEAQKLLEPNWEIIYADPVVQNVNIVNMPTLGNEDMIIKATRHTWENIVGVYYVPRLGTGDGLRLRSAGYSIEGAFLITPYYRWWWRIDDRVSLLCYSRNSFDRYCFYIIVAGQPFEMDGIEFPVRIAMEHFHSRQPDLDTTGYLYGLYAKWLKARYDARQTLILP